LNRYFVMELTRLEREVRPSSRDRFGCQAEGSRRLLGALRLDRRLNTADANIASASAWHPSSIMVPVSHDETRWHVDR
jgi:hypothetical protein